MASDFGTLAIPRHFQDEDVNLDALLPHVPNRSFHDERSLPASWPAEVHGIITDYLRVRDETFDLMPGVRVLSFAGTGVSDWIDVPAATRRGIAVCNVPDWGNDSIAEFTFGLILAVAKKLLPSHAMALQTVWPEEELRSLELRGMTIGLVGLGNIGLLVAEIAQGFGLTVLAYTQNPGRPRRATSARVEFVALDELLRRSNILSLHCKLTDETRGLIGARELALLPPRAILVNTARGPVVDTAALVAALKSGTLWGAGLDVFDQEPLPEQHPLKGLPNVVLAPHVAGQTDTARRKLYASTVSNIDAFVAGNPVNFVNPEVLRR